MKNSSSSADTCMRGAKQEEWLRVYKKVQRGWAR
jgi:hypothetical protein